MDKFESFDDLLNALEASENPQLNLFEMTVAQARQQDPGLAEALGYCAIPRHFDDVVIGILRGQPDETETNQQLLSQLRMYNFVIQRRDGSYVYHDNTRDMLLDDWRTESKRETFRIYNDRLIQHFQAQIEAAKQDLASWRQVAFLVQQANPARFRLISSETEQRLATLHVESLYHRLLDEAESGFHYFTDTYHELERENLFNVCTALMNVVFDYHASITPTPRDREAQENRERWLEYYRLRLASKLNERDSRQQRVIATELQTLLERVQDDDQLRSWILSGLGYTWLALSDYARARQAFETALPLVEEGDVDRWNLAGRLINLGDLYWRMEMVQTAAGYFERAVRAAQDEGNAAPEYSARASLALIQRQMGDWEQGFETTLRLLHDIRRRDPDKVLYWQVGCWNFLDLLLAFPPSWFNSAVEQIVTLLEIIGDPRGIEDINVRLIDLLRENGQVQAAERQLAEIQPLLDEQPDSVLTKEALYQIAFLYKERGLLEAAIQTFQRLGDHTQSTEWDHAAALSNRGEYEIWLSQNVADDHLSAAIESWEQIRVPKIASVVRVIQAEYALHHGQYERAQTLLDTARPHVMEERNGREINWYRVQGLLYEAQGQWADANAQFLTGVKVSERLRLRRDSAELYHDLARVARRQGSWREAARYSALASDRCQHLAAEYDQATPDQVTASQANADGLRLLYASTDDRLQLRLPLAQAKFKDASDLEPKNVLYALNWMHSSAEREEWSEAAQASERLLELSATLMDQPLYIEECYIEHHLQQGHHLINLDHREEALALYRKVWRQLSQPESRQRFLHDLYQLGPEQADTSNRLTIATPIVMVTHMGLLPDDPENTSELFRTYLPDLRQRIRDQWGVSIPGVNIRGTEDNFDASTYLIMLDDVPLVSDTIELDKVYTPTPPDDVEQLGIPRDVVLAKNNPLSDESGCWVETAYVETLRAADLPVWPDPLQFVVHHLEAILQRNLATFLDAQDVANLVDDWQAEDAGLVETVLPDETAQLRLGHVLRQLVAEGVPIIDWRTILQTIRDVGLGGDEVDIIKSVIAVRQQLRAQLPGNRPGDVLVTLPVQTEETIDHCLFYSDRKVVLAMPPEETQAVLAVLGTLVPQDQPRQVLVVQDTWRRPFVRRLVEPVYPHLMVLAQAERLTP